MYIAYKSIVFQYFRLFTIGHKYIFATHNLNGSICIAMYMVKFKIGT